MKHYKCDYEQDLNIVEDWLKSNQPNVCLGDICTRSTALLILKKSNVAITDGYDLREIFGNIGTVHEY